MANRCYLESYVPISSLTGEKGEYWASYVEKVVPKFEDIFSAESSDVEKVIKETITNIDVSSYPVKPYALVDGEYFVHDGDMTYNYFIPDQFLLCFDKDDKIETNVNKELYDSLSEEEKGEYDLQFKFFKINSTALKARELLMKHLNSIDNKSKEYTGYLEMGNRVLNFLSQKDERAIISLFSGETCMDDSVDSIITYFPA